MRIITTSCPNCRTVLAANELESHRVMKCPGLGCEYVFRFEADLTVEEQEYFIENRDQYRLDG